MTPSFWNHYPAAEPTFAVTVVTRNCDGRHFFVVELEPNLVPLGDEGEQAGKPCLLLEMILRFLQLTIYPLA